MASPAQAGLGDLLGEVLEDPVSDLTAPLAPVLTAVPVVEDLTETVDTVIAPVVTIVEKVASPVVSTVDEVASPVIDIVTDEASPVLDIVEPVIGTVEPTVDASMPLPSVQPTITPEVRVVDPPATSPSVVVPTGTAIEQAPVVAPVTKPNTAPPTATSAVSEEVESLQRVLLASISSTDIAMSDREGIELTDREGNAPVEASLDWLTAIEAWLQSGISSLFDLLAIPARLFELLLRALSSAGSGLVAPAAILGALAVGGRRRLLPVT